MWHELVLHGIGGCTIAEAKERLTYEEALSWFAFINKRGSLNDGMRLEGGFALIAMMISRAMGGKAEMADFMPHVEKDDPLSIDSVFKKLTGAK